MGHLNLNFDDNGELLEFQGQPILLDGSKRQGIFKNISIKVENGLEDSLDLIPSPLPSVKIQIIGGKVYLRQ